MPAGTHREASRPRRSPTWTGPSVCASTTAIFPTRSSGTTPRQSRTESASPRSPAFSRRPAWRARRWSSPPSPRRCRTRAGARLDGRSPPAARRGCTSSCSRSEAADRRSCGSSVSSGSRRTESSVPRPGERCARSRSDTACSSTASSARRPARRSSRRSRRPRPTCATSAPGGWCRCSVRSAFLRTGSTGRSRVGPCARSRSARASSSTVSSGRRPSARSASGAARLRGATAG